MKKAVGTALGIKRGINRALQGATASLALSLAIFAHSSSAAIWRDPPEINPPERAECCEAPPEGEPRLCCGYWVVTCEDGTECYYVYAPCDEVPAFCIKNEHFDCTQDQGGEDVVNCSCVLSNLPEILCDTMSCCSPDYTFDVLLNDLIERGCQAMKVCPEISPADVEAAISKCLNNLPIPPEVTERLNECRPSGGGADGAGPNNGGSAPSDIGPDGNGPGSGGGCGGGGGGGPGGGAGNGGDGEKKNPPVNTDKPEPGEPEGGLPDDLKDLPPRDGWVYAMPVDLIGGNKVENEVDLSIPVTGGAFVVSREYTSNTGWNRWGYVGANWRLSLFDFIQIETVGGDDQVSLYGANASYRTIFTKDGSVWKPVTASRQRFTQTTLTIGSTTYNVWRLTEPGQWEVDFYRAGSGVDSKLIGMIAQRRDAHGNATTWEYDYFTGGTNDYPRPYAVYVNGTTLADAEAFLDVQWHNMNDGGDPRHGRVNLIRAYHRISSGSTIASFDETDYVDYVYAAEVNGSPDLSGDDQDNLVQVVHGSRVEGPSTCRAYTVDGRPFWLRFTQYRYYDQQVSGTQVGTPYGTSGKDHQLKLVIHSEQIGWLAQRLATAGSSLLYPPHDPSASAVDPELAVPLTAGYLLTLDDDETTGVDGKTPLDMAAKILGYDATSNRVTTQYVQAGCGCGSTAQGLKLTYDYWSYTSSSVDVTTRVAQFLHDGSGYPSTAYRQSYYDFVELTSSSIPFVQSAAVFEGNTTSGRKWVMWLDRDSSGRITKMAYPSAVSSYSAGTSTGAPSITVSSSAGLVWAYEYDANHLVTEIRVGNGNKSTFTDFTLVDEIDYRTDVRSYLPATWKRYRVAGSTAANDTETVTWDYGFHNSGHAIAWVKSSEEAELSGTENGSGATTHDSYELFDTAGRNLWSRDAAGTLTFRGFHPYNGRVTKVVRNASPTAPDGVSGDALDGSDYPSLGSVTGWTQGTGGELTSRYEFDSAARLTRSTDAGGNDVFYDRVLSVSDLEGHESVYYLTELTLPNDIAVDSLYSDTISARWLTTSGKVIRTSEYLVGGSSYAPSYPYPGDYTLGTEVARKQNTFSLGGLVSKAISWHDVANDKFFETDFTYNQLGLLEVRSSPREVPWAAATEKREITQYLYDVLDRLTTVKVGTETTNTVTVSESFYDHDSGPAQGDGDGNLTLVRLHESASAVRDTIHKYDWRNRRYASEPEAGPYDFTEYDNLDRPTERGIFGTVPSSISSSDRRMYTRMSYSQRGLVYRQEVAIDPGDLGDGFLATDYWFDPEARTLALRAPNSPMTKAVFDAHGRTTTSYATDGSGSDPRSVTGDRVIEQQNLRYNAAGLVDFMTTLRRQPTATATGPLDDSGLSDANKGVPTYVGHWYDAADRLARTVNFGTARTDNTFSVGATSPASTWPPSSAPDINEDEDGTDSDKIITGTTFDAEGRPYMTFDSYLDETASVDHRRKKRWTRTYFDDLDRAYATVENYIPTSGLTIAWGSGSGEGRWKVTAGLSTSYPDRNRVTSFVLDAAGATVKQVAHLPHASDPEQVQVTQYNYGVTITGTGSTDNFINSNSLLGSVRYPDESTGEAGSGASYTVAYRYNRLGELNWSEDQNGTEHTYTRDVVGRVTRDVASDLGSGIDGAVRAIKVAYDTTGRLDKVESTSDTSATTVVNAVRFRYTPLWQVAKVYQDHNGVVETSGGGDDAAPINDTKVVQYNYADSPSSSNNRSRLESLAYPDNVSPANESLLTYSYGTSGDVDDRISRVRAMTLPMWQNDDVVNYERLGLDMVTLVNYGVPLIQLDRTYSHDGKRETMGYTEQTDGLYPGWDRFGRVQRHAWVDYGTHDDSGSSYPTQPPIVEETSTYDWASNKLTKVDARPGASWDDRDHTALYNALDQLRQLNRGHYSGSSFTFAPGSQKWSLDMLGNWASVINDTGDGDFADSGEPETRAHNMANELTSRTPDGGSAKPLTYDAAGNLTSAKPVFTGTVQEYRYVHDAWNRLVKIEQDSGLSPSTVTRTVGVYQYNGLHWRTVKDADTQGALGLDQRRIMYYSAGWQMLTELVDDYTNTTGGPPSGFAADRVTQQVWGLRYIDDPVLRRIDTDHDGSYSDEADDGEPNGDSTTEHAYWHVTDTQFSTVAMMGRWATEIERVSYSAYGVATHRWPGDVNNDGSVTSADGDVIEDAMDAAGLTAVPIGHAEYKVEADIDRSGAIDDDDLAAWAGLPSRTPLGGPGSGMISDSSGPDSAIGYCGYVFNREHVLYTVRFRAYSPAYGRWLERDPAGTVDGPNLFEYVGSRPLFAVDPSGLKLRVIGDQQFRNEVLAAIKKLCPSATIDSDGTIRVAEQQNAPAQPCRKECQGNPPGCAILDAIINSPDDVPIQKSFKSYEFGWKWNNKNEIIKLWLNWDPSERSSGGIDRHEFIEKRWGSLGRLFDRKVAKWEVLWHELIHAYHYASGSHFARVRRKGTPLDIALEEYWAIRQMNELAAWWRWCGEGDDPTHGLAPGVPRDPYGHPAQDGIYRGLPNDNTTPPSDFIKFGLNGE
ncbi:MAG: hypothetical protein AMXMBFR58_11400 [Phycisphaerae bacterium]